MAVIGNLRADSPLRPTDWRWEKAKLLHNKKKTPSRRWDDDKIVKAMKFLDDLDGLEDDWDQFEVLEKWPAMYDAWMIRQDSGTCRRWELEAWLLARDASFTKISKWCGIKPAVIYWYEALFFNVRDRLKDSGWIATVVLGRSYHMALNDNDFELLWKAFSWRGGAVVLEDIMTRLVEDGGASGTAPGWYKQQHRAIAGRNAVMAGLTMRSRDPYVKSDMLELQRKYFEMDQSSGAVQAADDAMLAGVHALLDCFSLNVISRSDEASRISIVDGAEMRTPLLMGKSTDGSFTMDTAGAEYPKEETIPPGDVG